MVIVHRWSKGNGVTMERSCWRLAPMIFFGKKKFGRFLWVHHSNFVKNKSIYTDDFTWLWCIGSQDRLSLTFYRESFQEFLTILYYRVYVHDLNFLPIGFFASIVMRLHASEIVEFTEIRHEFSVRRRSLCRLIKRVGWLPSSCLDSLHISLPSQMKKNTE